MEKNNTFHEEDEIDLLDVIKPLVKYKLQLIVILILGAAVLLFIGSRQVVQPKVQQSDIKIEPITEILKISQQAVVPVFEIRNFEYEYSQRGKFVSVLFGADEKQLGEYLSKQGDNVTSVFVNINRSSTGKLHTKLSRSLNQISNLDQTLVNMKFEKAIIDISQYLEGKEPIRKADEFWARVNKKNVKKRNLILEVKRLIQSISQPVWGEINNDKIPWMVFEIFEKTKIAPRFNVNRVNQIVDKLSGSTFTEKKISQKLYNYLQNQNLLDAALKIDIPVVHKLNSYIASQKPVVQPEKSTSSISKKMMVVGVIGILIFAVISVYLRVWIEWLLKSDKDSDRWKEFMAAVKYWKL